MARSRTKADDDFQDWAARHLSVLDKQGGLVPFRLNPVQQKVHKQIEAQRRRTGRVRALILKARQPGISTYVAGRFYQATIRHPGMRAFILTHLGDATASVYSMVSRFHENCTDPARPDARIANSRELLFAESDSGYRVGTAGTKTIGRGHTFRLFHGSEVAFWANADLHMAGILQTVPDADGTEIILESTANGPAGLYFDMCKAAERGEGEFELIFVPWFAHHEYTTRPPRGWTAPPALLDYAKLHKLKRGQLYWLWRKNGMLARGCGADDSEICWLFRQEYPATAEEAFRGAAHDGLIRPDLVTAARHTIAPPQDHLPLVLGVDIARGGADKTHIIDRQGRRAGAIINRVIDSGDLMEVAGLVGREIDRLGPDMVFLDGTGIGAGVL